MYSYSILLSMMIFFCNTLLGDWYVWQRQWSPAVVAAVENAGADRLFLLRAELEIEGKKWQWKRVQIPEKYNAAAAVLRAPAKALNNPEKLLQELQNEIANLETRAIQLDIDVPESKLDDYALLLRQLKSLLPQHELSITLLPSHLNRQECSAAIAAVDWWVLQLHGIEAPKHRSDNYRLMDRAVVTKALARARATNSFFKIALPTYAYVLSFNSDGTFRRLYAEGFSGNREDPDLELAAPDLALIASVIRDNPDLELLWFRLPIKNDRWTLSTDTVALLSQGIVPEAQIEQRNQIKDNRLSISFRWLHQIPLHRQTVPLQIPPEWRKGECMLLNGAAPSGYVYGTIPETIQVPPARCGEEIPVAIITSKKAKP